MSDGFIGEIRLLPFNRGLPPYGWLNCDGSAQLIAQYPALNAVIGGLYGASTTTNFILPNLQGHAPVGAGSAPGLTARTTGKTFGTETVPLPLAQIPAHTHQLNGAFQNDTTVALTAQPVVGDYFTFPQYSAGTGNWSSNSYDTGTISTTLANATLGTVGGSTAHENRQPFLVLRWCICWNGNFPMRP